MAATTIWSRLLSLRPPSRNPPAPPPPHPFESLTIPHKLHPLRSPLRPPLLRQPRDGGPRRAGSPRRGGAGEAAGAGGEEEGWHRPRWRGRGGLHEGRPAHREAREDES